MLRGRGLSDAVSSPPPTIPLFLPPTHPRLLPLTLTERERREKRSCDLFLFWCCSDGSLFLPSLRPPTVVSTFSVVLHPSGLTTSQYLRCSSDGRRKSCGCLAREHAERVSLAGHPRRGMLNGSREGLFELGKQLQQEGDSQAALHCFLSSLLGLTHVESFHSLPNCLHQVSSESAGWSSIKMHFGIKMIQMPSKCIYCVCMCNTVWMCCIQYILYC